MIVIKYAWLVIMSIKKYLTIPILIYLMQWFLFKHFNSIILQKQNLNCRSIGIMSAENFWNLCKFEKLIQPLVIYENMPFLSRLISKKSLSWWYIVKTMYKRHQKDVGLHDSH